MAGTVPTDDHSQRSDAEAAQEQRNGDRVISINDFHYHANDLAELRKIAEIDPRLAEMIIAQRDREHAREKASYTLGLISAFALLAMVLGAFGCLLIFVGLLETFAVVGGILAAALLVRVILTGEWSDTSWMGRFLNLFVKVLGGTPISEDDTTRR